LVAAVVQRKPVEFLVSAGGVVYRPHNGTVELLLCGRRSPATWSLPKGTPEAGESLEETAVREVREETGLEVALLKPLGAIRYWFARPTDGVRCRKTVHFYLMRAVGGSLEGHDPEFDEVRWFSAPEALRALTHVNEAGMAEKALAQAEAQG
jgi:8-oxo-dGTP pyrophosphatase MutT (NUDIX family)